MHRRTFILGGLTTLITAPNLVTAKAYALPPSHLRLYNTHTNEYLEMAYKRYGGVTETTLSKLNHFLRDHRTNQVCNMDQQLFNLLYELQRYSRNLDGVFEIISGYRSPQTNAALCKASEGVAKHSLHQKGRALDIRLRGMSTAKLRALATELQCGGVGYYPRSDFTHIDTGDVRYW
jgi:uncharacterized protein YcbK (DUF882 family)